MDIFRYIFISSLLAKVLNSRVIQGGLAAVSGAYFLILDIWGDDLGFVKNHLEAHKFMFAILLSITLLSQLFHAVSGWFADKSRDSYSVFLEDFMLLTGRVVQKKLTRFKKAAPNLRPNGDAFKAITKPEDQISYILDLSLAWFRKSFGLGEEQISITVLQIKDDGERCFYAFEDPEGWSRTRAKKVLEEDSTARSCLESGQPIFHADKLKIKQGYYVSSRDSEREGGVGSIYCYPVTVEIPGFTDRYVISISTYGKTVCSSTDIEAVGIARSIFREVCRRIELELTLNSIRLWKSGE